MSNNEEKTIEPRSTYVVTILIACLITICNHHQQIKSCTCVLLISSVLDKIGFYFERRLPIVQLLGGSEETVLIGRTRTSELVRTEAEADVILLDVLRLQA